MEGSGGTDREIKSDLESSGSGFGPDDEDGDDAGSGDVDSEFMLFIASAWTLHFIFDFHIHMLQFFRTSII